LLSKAKGLCPKLRLINGISINVAFEERGNQKKLVCLLNRLQKYA